MTRNIILKTLLPLLAMVLSYSLAAQISLGGLPKSFQLGLTDDNIQEVVMPQVDVKALAAEDIERALDNFPYRFAQGFPVSYNINNIGTWTTLANGDRIWRLKISCQQALSVNFLYDDFFIPEGGLYYIYAADLTEVLGAFGAHNNRASRKFATGLIESTSVVLEYYEPAAVAGQGSISVNQVSHAYRGFQDVVSQSEGLGDAGSCQVNINCPEGDDWQTEKKGVARIIINGIETCTGTLINNIAGNCTPYFLTANHCIDGTYDAVTNPDLSGAVFYWNYERPGCANTGSVPNETTSGATLVSNSNPVGGDANASDFALFLLDEDPSDLYDVYAVGFDASGLPGTGGVGIHHPGLDAKKIATHSITPDSVVNDNYWRIFWDATANGHSVTEGGSSGSALFNSDKRLIGQLFGGFLGGQPNCSDPAEDEGDYGRLSISWDNRGATDSRRRLRDWLDPNNTGLKVVDGRFCTIPDYDLEADPLSSTNCGADVATYTINIISRNDYTDPVTLSVSGLPAGASASFGTNPVTPGNSTSLTISGLNSLADGSYGFDLNGSSTSGNKTLALGLEVADQSAATLVSPADGATDISSFALLTWNVAIGAASYDVEVATDASFTNVVASANVPNNNWTVSPELNFLTTYYWRVRNVRSCGVDPWSAAFSFTTGDANPGTCGKPIQLVCGGTFSGNNADGEDNFQQHDPGGNNSWTGPELIFEFQAAAGDVEAQITGLTADLDLYLFTDCGDPVNSELDESESTSSTETVSATVGGGTYFLMVDGFQGATSDFDLTLTCTPLVTCDPLTAPTLLTPTNGATNVSITPTLTWTAEPMAIAYDVQVATDVAFSNVVASANVSTASWVVTPELMGSATYFWRVRNVQSCGNDPWTAAFSFTTETLPIQCGTIVSTDIPVAIPDETTIISTINVPESGSITDIDVLFRGDHDAVRDLIFELISPAGTTIQLVDLDDPCNRQDDFDIGFDDQSALTINADVPCPPTDGRYYQPEQALSTFNGEEVNGTWTLRVTDDRSNNTGQLNYWELAYCVETGAACDSDMVLDVNPISAGTYSSADSINAAGTVQAGDVVSFEAGELIRLNAGFVAENGSTFTASIQACTAATEGVVEARTARTERVGELVKIYPNPLQAQAIIEINLAVASEVAVDLYNLTGQQVASVQRSSQFTAGIHQFRLDASHLESGIYLVMLRMGDQVQTRKLSVVK
ncbi:MAG: T9SS type A sorting domain-containing protein [Bacteroidota bacterium]